MLGNCSATELYPHPPDFLQRLYHIWIRNFKLFLLRPDFMAFAYFIALATTSSRALNPCGKEGNPFSFS
jgi:hypothetical protein